MRKDDQKLSMWMIAGAIACCALPLLLLAGGGSTLALITGYLTGNNLLFILALILTIIFVWLVFKRKGQ